MLGAPPAHAWFLLSIVLAGCTSMLDLESPVREQPDAAPVDVPADAVDAAATCPPAPAGCAPFRCAVTPSCYYACSGRTNWIAAESYCTQMSSPASQATGAVAALVTIEGPLEQDCVVAAMEPTGSDPVWLGLYQLDAATEPDQGWKWASGETDSWRKWASFEPYDWAGDRDCASMGANGDWKADVCTVTHRFACKVDPY